MTKSRKDCKNRKLKGTPKTQELRGWRGELSSDDLIIDHPGGTVLYSADIKRINAEPETAAAVEEPKLRRLRIPTHCIDVTSERLGESIAIIGARRPPLTKP